MSVSIIKEHIIMPAKCILYLFKLFSENAETEWDNLY